MLPCMHDFEDSDDRDDKDDKSVDEDGKSVNDYDDDVDCYTHTESYNELEGQCWVPCDRTLLWPCNSTISDNLLL